MHLSWNCEGTEDSHQDPHWKETVLGTAIAVDGKLLQTKLVL